MQPCSLLSLATAVPPHVIEPAEAKESGATPSPERRRCSTGCRACSTMPGSPGAISSRRPNGMKSRTAGPSAMPSIWSGREPVRRSRERGNRKARADAAPDRRRRHRLDHRHRHPQPRSAGRAEVGFAPTSAACRSSAWAAPAASTASSIAARLAAAEPGSNWLFVTVETCSISIRLDSDDPAAIVATALFGDGAAAAVVTSGEHSLARIIGSAEKMWPDTLRIMGWDVEDPGLAVVFDRAIPPFIEAELAEAVDEMCGKLGIGARRHRPLLLPSRRGEGDRRDRDRARPQPGRAQPRARGAARLSAI